MIRGRRNPLHHGLAKRLRAARRAVGESPHGLSVAAGVASPVASSIEDGAIPRLDIVEKLARVLKISPCGLAYNVAAPFLESVDLQCARVGQRLQQVRMAQGLSRKALARSASSTDTTIRLTEEGATMPSVGTVEALAKALGIDPCWLAYGHGTAPDLPQR